MTKDEALKLALEALDEAIKMWREEMEYRSCIDAADSWEKTSTAIKQARSAPVQEPDAYLHDDGYWTAAKTYAGRQLNDRLLFAGSAKIGVYTTQPAAQPALKPLTDEEIIKHFQAKVNTGSLLSFADGVRYAEAAHGIKDKST